MKRHVVSAALVAGALAGLAAVSSVALSSRMGAASPASPRAGVVRGGPGEDSTDRVRGHLYYLASDELGGRGAGTPGYRLAADYVERELRDYGAAPLFPSSGAADSYRQPFTMRRWRIEREGRLVLRQGDRSTALELLRDFQVVSASAGDEWLGVHHPVYVGLGIHRPESGWNDYEGLDLQGRPAILLWELPPRHAAALPADVRPLYPAGNDGLRRRAADAMAQGASSLIVVPGPQAPEFWPQFISDDSQLERQEPEPPAALQTAAGFSPVVVGLSQQAQQLLFEGQAGGPGSATPLRPFELAGTRLGFELEMQVDQSATDWNLGAWIPGSDRALSEQAIVLSAHLDGQGTRADGTVLNSANDNASSVAALLEVARGLVASPARRPVAVVFFGAEEVGLSGSRVFVDDPPVPLARTALVINSEMIGERARGGDGYSFRVSGRQSDDLGRLVSAAGSRHGGVELDYVRRRDDDGERLFRNSDHVHFFLRGVPTIYFHGGRGTGTHYHRPSDDADTVDLGKVAALSRLLLDLLAASDEWELLPRADGHP